MYKLIKCDAHHTNDNYYKIITVNNNIYYIGTQSILKIDTSDNLSIFCIEYLHPSFNCVSVDNKIYIGDNKIILCFNTITNKTQKLCDRFFPDISFDNFGQIHKVGTQCFCVGDYVYFIYSTMYVIKINVITNVSYVIYCYRQNYVGKGILIHSDIYLPSNTSILVFNTNDDLIKTEEFNINTRHMYNHDNFLCFFNNGYIVRYNVTNNEKTTLIFNKSPIDELPLVIEPIKISNKLLFVWSSRCFGIYDFTTNDVKYIHTTIDVFEDENSSIYWKIMNNNIVLYFERCICKINVNTMHHIIVRHDYEGEYFGILKRTKICYVNRRCTQLNTYDYKRDQYLHVNIDNELKNKIQIKCPNIIYCNSYAIEQSNNCVRGKHVYFLPEQHANFIFKLTIPSNKYFSIDNSSEDENDRALVVTTLSLMHVFCKTMYKFIDDLLFDVLPYFCE